MWRARAADSQVPLLHGNHNTTKPQAFQAKKDEAKKVTL
jgi:hypothetical protein